MILMILVILTILMILVILLWFYWNADFTKNHDFCWITVTQLPPLMWFSYWTSNPPLSRLLNDIKDLKIALTEIQILMWFSWKYWAFKLFSVFNDQIKNIFIEFHEKGPSSPLPHAPPKLLDIFPYKDILSGITLIPTLFSQSPE